jgi:hypothetical protein
VQWQARATPSGPIRFAIPRRSGGLASMSMSAPVTVARRYKPPSFSTGALPASVSRQSRHRPRARALAFLARCTLYTSAEPCAVSGRDLLGRNWPRRLWAEREGAQRADRRARGESDPRFALRPRIRRRSAADRCEIWALVPIDCFAVRRDYNRPHVKELRPFQEIRGYYSYILLINFSFTLNIPAQEPSIRGQKPRCGEKRNV